MTDRSVPMTTPQFLNPGHFGPAIGPYSQAVRVGDFVFLSGQAAVSDVNEALAPGDIAEQTRITIGRIRDVLAEAGGTLANVVTATTFLTDLALFDAYNGAWSHEFGDHKPARATVRAELAIPGLLVEIQSIAHLGS
jgi:2-iminobutanoate/2-iminopropanoate deaminase